VFYFIGVIFFCSFYLVNLTLAIVANTYHEQVTMRHIRNRNRKNNFSYLIYYLCYFTVLPFKLKRELEERDKKELALSNEIPVNTDETEDQLKNESSFLNSKFIKSNFIESIYMYISV